MLLLAVATAAGLAAAAGGPVVPGLALRFGETLARVDSTRTWSVDASGVPGREVRHAAMTFFGVPAEVTLRFVDARLATAEATAVEASPAAIDHIIDELRRMGLRRTCETDSPERSVCSWAGRALVRLDIEGVRLHASMERARAVTAEVAAPSHPGPPPLFHLEAPAESAPYPLPEVIHREEPVYPAIARRAGVMGRVRVRAQVDTTGAVASTDVLNSIPMLDRAALECVRRWRFTPYVVQGRVVPFRIVVPVLFLLDR